MKVRAQKFEANHQMYFFDIWEYVKRKLETPDFKARFVHPTSQN